MPSFIDGFLTRFLTTGRVETPFNGQATDTDPLRLEKRMRAMAAKHAPFTPPDAKTLRVGNPSPLGVPWRYYYSHGNIFLDDSSFYIELCSVELHAATVLRVPYPMTVAVRLFSYDAADVWLNGERVATLATPCYKPIQEVTFTLRLPAGDNTLYFRLETLGVRDTRIALALEFLNRPPALEAILPNCSDSLSAASLLDGASLQGDTLCLSEALPQGSRLCYFTGESDFRKKDRRFVWQDVSNLQTVTLLPYATFTLEIPAQGSVLRRGFTRLALLGPVYLKEDCNADAENHQLVLEEIAKVASVMREETDGFALYPMLARRALGRHPASDDTELMVTLRQIERRMDCADFMTCALIRLYQEYGIDPEQQSEMERVMLNFRYWMDEPGQDGMCFWSENHTLMFFQTAYFFGALWPDKVFSRSGLTGTQMREKGRAKLLEWLQDVNRYGFGEFNSGVYSTITFSALLNVVDYAEPELSKLAVLACDKLMRQAALHVFHDVVISPEGRDYSGVLTPWRSSLQALVQWVRPKAPYSRSEWLSAFATTRYRVPDDLDCLMNATGNFTYPTDNAVIDLRKTAEYCLTSVQSPRRDGVERVWWPDERETMRDHFLYVKSLNEHFHGTTQFKPGEYGYQQHLWTAALAKDLIVFVNHPGQSCESATEIRPGYWYGNTIMPALRQEGNVLGAIYAIPQNCPIRFVHLYWDSEKFDEQCTQDRWLFGRKENSYIGIWCSADLEDHDDALFGCEKRANTSTSGWLVVCSGQSESKNFAAFTAACARRCVTFDESARILTCAEFTLISQPAQNGTQIVG